MNRLTSLFIVSVLVILNSSAYALEGLIELETRRDNRKTTNTFYSGETVEGDYVRQPMTVIYTDTTTGHEVTILTQTKNKNSYPNWEYGAQMWSADGARMMFGADLDTLAFTRSGITHDHVWYVSRSDGSYLRAGVNVADRGMKEKYYSDWSPVEPDVFYSFGDNNNGLAGLDENMLYKHTVSDASINRATFIDFIPADTSTEIRTIKDNSTADGQYFIGMTRHETTPFYIADMATPEIKQTYAIPTYDSYWGSVTGLETGYHDEMLVGSAAGGYWFYGLPGDSATWHRQRLWGTDNGAPNQTIDNVAPYDWWVGTDAQKEIQIINSRDTIKPDFQGNYWSHAVPDRWGAKVLYTDANGPWVGAAVWDVDSSTRTAFPASEDNGTTYHVWTGWTDYAASTVYGGGSASDVIGIQKYDGGTNIEYIAYGHWFGTTDGNTKPAQSPDGTKVAYKSDWMVTASARTDVESFAVGDVYVANTYYPYPPEITSVTSGVVRFEWMLDQVTPRGYTERGWPIEGVSDPTAPRETRSFRLWKSANGTTGWEPVTTIDVAPFDKFDFVLGGLKGGQVAYWEITDPSPSGYYAVTAIEHSGYESRTLSNVFNAAGSQTAAYPVDPGGDTDFLTAYNEDCLRYYDIFYGNGVTPDPTPEFVVGSIVGMTTMVDWQAAQNSNGQYRVRKVDTQGNVKPTDEEITVTYQLAPATAPGQYTITIGTAPEPTITATVKNCTLKNVILK